MVIRAIILMTCFAIGATAQQNPGDIKVRVNYVNACSPSEADLKEISAVLDRIPLDPHFAADFEVARGRTTDEHAASDWVRMRREISGQSIITNVQYSVSSDPRGVLETSVFRWRDPKEVLQVAIEDSVTVGTPAAVVSTDHAGDAGSGRTLRQEFADDGALSQCRPASARSSLRHGFEAHGAISRAAGSPQDCSRGTGKACGCAGLG